MGAFFVCQFDIELYFLDNYCMKKILLITLIAILSIFGLLVTRKNTLAFYNYYLSKSGLYSVSEAVVLGSDNENEEDEKEDEEDEDDEKENEDIDDEKSKIEQEVEIDSDSDGKRKLEIKRESRSGKVELKIEDDGRINFKIKNEDGENEFHDTLEATETGDMENLLKILPYDTGKSKFRIKVQDKEFEVSETGESAGATTKFPLAVDPATNTLIVTTPSGNVNIQVLPAKAILNLLNNSKDLSVDSSELELNEKQGNSDDALVYKMRGKRLYNLLGVYPIFVSTEATVGATTGSVLANSVPWYVKAFSFLFQEQ